MSQKRRILSYVLAYLLWIVSTGIAVLILNLMRETVLLALVVTSAASEPTKSEQFYLSYQVAAASHWSILIVGLLALVLLVGLEHYYRESIEAGILWKRFFRATGLSLVVLFVTHTMYFLLRQNFVTIGGWTIAILIVEVLLAAFFLALSAFVQNKPLSERIS